MKHFLFLQPDDRLYEGTVKLIKSYPEGRVGEHVNALNAEDPTIIDSDKQWEEKLVDAAMMLFYDEHRHQEPYHCAAELYNSDHWSVETGGWFLFYYETGTTVVLEVYDTENHLNKLKELDRR